MEMENESGVAKFYAKRQVVMYVLGIIAFVLMGGWALENIGEIPSLIIMFTIIFTFMAIWMSTVPMAEFHDDHVIFRLSPVRAKKSFLYSEITSVDWKKSKFLVHYSLHSKDPGIASKTLKFPFSVFNKSDHTRLIFVMQNKLKSCKEDNKTANENIIEHGM
ncbi:hypothetical protein [Halomonas binhaiensis]|uniref:PH domain-containing protein n=1 Tax=Halomonas binhaiensis TaxID=2562282 RepID=A0A5C1NGI4_9GAMM|nr:hypothetical protein [Halomonas binhaiensis]QEM81538.1 hypothetical protein E4T21_08260 [Halomonas binhaiensis]